MKKDDELKGMTDSIAEVFGNNVQWVDPNNDKVVMELKDGKLIDHEDQDEDEWRETLLAQYAKQIFWQSKNKKFF